jgi:hypothetical protein
MTEYESDELVLINMQCAMHVGWYVARDVEVNISIASDTVCMYVIATIPQVQANMQYQHHVS